MYTLFIFADVTCRGFLHEISRVLFSTSPFSRVPDYSGLIFALFSLGDFRLDLCWAVIAHNTIFEKLLSLYFAIVILIRDFKVAFVIEIVIWGKFRLKSKV